MKRLTAFLVTFLAVTTSCLAQADYPQSDLERWQRAVIHLEGRTDKISYQEQHEHIRKLNEQQRNGEISTEEYLRLLTPIGEDLWYRGTAIFLQSEGRRYLLTARHVLWDSTEANREYREEVERLKSGSEFQRSFLLEYAEKKRRNQVFRLVLRVLTFDEILRGLLPQQNLMNLGSGVPDMQPYTFSKPEYDLAIISLNQRRTSAFADELEDLGYGPIDIADVADGPSGIGAKVFTVGFPAITSDVGTRNVNSHWESVQVSMPVFIFGRIASFDERLPFYWVDMSVSPGNSGGPIVEDGKLVGIVSAQPVVRGGITPFGKIIPAKYVKELLAIQIEKDKEWQR